MVVEAVLTTDTKTLILVYNFSNINFALTLFFIFANAIFALSLQ